MVYKILVASYSNDVYSLAFDPDVPSLTLTSALTVGHHPSWVTPHPRDPSLIFTGLEQSDGRILAIKYDEHNRGTVVGQISSLGADPCTLVVHERELLVGNYSSGKFVSIPLADAPPYLVEHQAASIQFHGTGPNRERQEASHPHQVFVHPERNEILVPDLGADKTLRLVKEEGVWTIKGEVSYPAGSGPRHLAFHDGVLYTALELTNEVSAHLLPPLPAAPTLVTHVSTLSKPPPQPALSEMKVAEILLPKPSSAFPTPYLYVSNRNDPSPAGDTIAIYSLLRNNSLELVAEVSTGLKHLRGMLFGGPDEKWLVAGGAEGGGVKVFERTEGGKGLKEIASIPLDAPTGFLWR